MTLPLDPGLRLPSGPAPGGRRWALCRTLRRLSMRTYGWLTDGRPDLVPNEVSITDHNLLVLRLRHPTQVLVARFTNREEPFNGADWEWWFGRPGRWSGMRVQAKKLDSQGRRYIDLRKTVGDPARDQIDVLRDSAGRAGLPACYVFYNGDSADSVAWRASECLGVQDWEWGCAIAGASSVKKVIDTGSDRVTDLGPISLPWAHLVCCGGAGTRGLAEHVARQLGVLGEESPSTRDVLPAYAQHLVDPDHARAAPPPELIGVAVIRDEEDQP
jgi:hypothetical protein